MEIALLGLSEYRRATSQLVESTVLDENGWISARRCRLQSGVTIGQESYESTRKKLGEANRSWMHH
jgi:hypothetical protein